ncbi:MULTISPECIES: hypothetical protein [Pseudomonas]|nr:MULTISPECIES: hypothetical protein [Pseudomonas]
MTNSMNAEIAELLWKCDIGEEEHATYIRLVGECLGPINRISALFTRQFGSDVNYELKIKTQDTISPDAGAMWGLHLITFQVKFIVELVKHYEKLYGFNFEKVQSEQRHRRLILAVCLAFCHELAHIVRGHDSNIVNAEALNNSGSKAAEADADFLAGMQLHKWFTGNAIGSELQKDIGLNNGAIGLAALFKDAGFCTVLLAFFLHNKLNPDNDEYHLPNVRAAILLSGILSGIVSSSKKYTPYINFLFAGYKEHIEYLERGVSEGFDAGEVEKFLQLCPLEWKELLEETAKEMDGQRSMSDKTSEIWKALYERAVKNNN